MSDVATATGSSQPGIFTSALSQSNEQDVLIRGTLIIDQDYWFCRSTVRLDVGAKIVIKAPNHLYFLGGTDRTFVEGCARM